MGFLLLEEKELFASTTNKMTGWSLNDQKDVNNILTYVSFTGNVPLKTEF